MATQNRDGAFSKSGLEKMDAPAVSCICELCDCGRHKHHKGCKKQQRVQRRETNRDCYITHYKATFSAPRHVAPRSSKRPSHTPVPRNLPPMNLATTQRAEFVPRPLEGRPKLCVPPLFWLTKHRSDDGGKLTEEKQEVIHSDKAKKHLEGKWKEKESYYQSPEESLLKQTVYGLHYPPKEAERTMPTRPPDNLHPPPPASSHHTTTNRDQFKQWKTERQSHYGELPTLAGAVLFPGDVCDMKTTTQEHFVEKKMKRVEPVKASHDHLTMEGEHYMKTTHQSTYHPLPLEKIKEPKEPLPKSIIKRPPLQAVTKYQSDFSNYYPVEPSKLAPPPTNNLTVNPFYSTDFRTVQREAFPGWNPALHPRPEPAQLKEELTAMDKERGGQVEGNTVTKLAFLPPEPQSREPVRRPRSVLRPLNGKFDGTTHSSSVFKDWGVQPRQRYGDPMDGVSLRPLVKLDSDTTTGTTFLPKKGELVRNCKPAKDNLELTGDRDFCTVHKETYRSPALPQCRMQIYLEQLRQNSPQQKENH